MGTTKSCSICGADFELRWSYQMEPRARSGPASAETSGHSFFCSQACLEKSHGGAFAEVRCDGCGVAFELELAAEVVFVGSRRRYACSPDCRARVLNAARAERHVPEASGDALVLAVFNHKGGTGKTTTAVTLAAGLAARGKRVLCVDPDGQGNVAVSLALKCERTLYHVLTLGIPLPDAVTPARPGLDVLASNETLAAAELYLAGRRRRDRVLAERLAAARALYDFVVVDCSPSLSLMNQNALVFADAVLCPVACDYLSLVGVRQVLRTVKHVNRLLSHPVRLWGVLPTQFDSRARICHEALATLRQHFRDRCFDPIRVASKVKEAPAQGKTLFELAPGSSAADDYERVVARLIEETSRHRAGAPVCSREDSFPARPDDGGVV
jgi:chromosome partitioning protein